MTIQGNPPAAGEKPLIRLSDSRKIMSTSSGKPDAAKEALRILRRSLFWRIHFWAALIASPFALIATVTGVLYIFTPQIEASLYHQLDHVARGGTMRPLDEAIAAATIAAPAGWSLHSVVPPYDAQDTVRATFAPPAASKPDGPRHHDGAKAASVPPPGFGSPARAVVVYVDPYTGEVVGSIADQARFGTWARKLHSRLLQNDNWRWMIELAASWLMVMLLTGIALWWPHSGWKALPQPAARGRIAWKRWHAFLGVALGAMSFTMLATGLTWSKYAGDQVRTLRDAIGQAPPQVPRDLKSVSRQGSAPLTWQAAWDATGSHTPDIALQMTPPSVPQQVWRITNVDRSQPEKRFDLLLDAYSGEKLYYSGWDKQTAFAKATAIGIPFHRGELGWWNQALLLFFGAGILFSLVSGWAMFFLRRPAGLPRLPRLLPDAWKSASAVTWMIAAGLLATMPLLALSATAVVMAEVLLHRPWRVNAAP